MFLQIRVFRLLTRWASLGIWSLPQFAQPVCELDQTALFDRCPGETPGDSYERASGDPTAEPPSGVARHFLPNPDRVEPGTRPAGFRRVQPGAGPRDGMLHRRPEGNNFHFPSSLIHCPSSKNIIDVILNRLFDEMTVWSLEITFTCYLHVCWKRGFVAYFLSKLTSF